MQRRVLIAHHRPALRHWLRYQVRHQFGMSVVAEASEGLSAYAKALDEKPDVAFISTGLPLMDGWELARHIRGSLPDCQVVLFTELPEDEDLRKIRETGAAGHLSNRDIERLGTVLAALNPPLRQLA